MRKVSSAEVRREEGVSWGLEGGGEQGGGEDST